MTNSVSSSLPQSLGNPITEDDIAHFLCNTPDFFQRHSELLAAVQFTSPHSKRTVSLQERQAEMLREKIKILEQRVMEMIRNGNDNVLLSDKILRWAGTLFLRENLADLPLQISEEIQNQFTVPQVAIRVWGVAAEFAQQAYATGVSEDAMVFASSLTEPFCGLNTGFEAAGWLPAGQHTASLALIPLRSPSDNAGLGPAFGLLVLGSPDAHRFHSGMGTDFLSRIGDLAGAALSRLR
jgi:uncharacterized protein